MWDGTEKMEKCQFESDILTITVTVTITPENAGCEWEKGWKMAEFSIFLVKIGVSLLFQRW